MTKEGFIFLHRQIMEWEWYSDINVTRVFIHCILEANHKDNKWQGNTIKKGTFVTSYEKLAIATSLTVQQVRTALNKLKSTGEITCKSTSRNSIITVNNWNKFQTNNKQDNKQITSKQQTNNKQITTNNNDNNDNNINNIFIIPKVEEIESYCKERNNKVDVLQFFDFYQSKGWMVGKNKMKDWKAAVRNWERAGNKTNKASPVKLKKYNPYYNVYAEEKQYGY